MLDIREGDCREVMAQMEPASVDAIVTDPPYGLEFMGKEWDHGVPGLMFWFECLRVAKPGAHLVAFGGTRTFHRLACALEDAGWEIRDCLCWLYGSGFPKSLDVSKAIDKAAGAERKVIGEWKMPGRGKRGEEQRYGLSNDSGTVTAPTTDSAHQWSGWGTALKPAWEPIILARKPLAGTVAANVQAHGTGALNVDGCRIEAVGGSPSIQRREAGAPASCRPGEYGDTIVNRITPERYEEPRPGEALGRWPANVVLDEEAARLLDEQSGELTSRGNVGPSLGHSGTGFIGRENKSGGEFTRDSGGASRFFYTAKAASSERHYAGKNTHPTVKPVDLMRWLCRLVTPPGGLILDPFCGSGSTGVAALAEGFRFIGIELDPDYVQLARKRIAGPLFAANGLAP